MAISRGYCPNCDKDVVTETQSPSHLIHLVITIFTAGLWLPVWIILAIDPKKNCRECGSRASGSRARAGFDKLVKYGVGAFFSVLILLVLIAMMR